MTDYFVSDPHFWHKNIIKYSHRIEFMNQEEFLEYDRLKSMGDLRMQSLKISNESVEKMNYEIIEEWNKKVKALDTLWCLGDFYIGYSQEQLVKLRNMIRCRTIHLIYGNHDQKWLRKHCPPYVFSSGSDVRFIKICGQEIFLSHYAHIIWPKNHRGAWHLFGHSHSNLNKWIQQHLPNAKCLDVGIDNRPGDYLPWSFEEIKSYMDNKCGEILDHHNED